MPIEYRGKDHFTCREVVELVTEYLEQAMPARERALFETHLTLCAGCTNYAEQIRQTIAALGRLRENQPAPAHDELIDAFRRLRAQG